MKKTGLNKYVYDFSDDYNATAVDDIYKMFELIKRVFVVSMSFFSCNALESVSMNNQECKVRPEIENIKSNEPSLYSVEISKFSSSCNNITDLYAKACVPDVSKNMNVEVSNIIWRANETRYIK